MQPDKSLFASAMISKPDDLVALLFETLCFMTAFPNVLQDIILCEIILVVAKRAAQ